MFIFRSCPFFILALVWCFGSKIVPRLLLGILTMINVWLLARWSDNFHFWYPIDIFTVYFLVWQFSYLMFQWCYHQLSWPFLIFYQASLCILIAIGAFIMYDLVFRYFSTINLVVIWFVCFYDVFACLHIHGRLRNMMNNSSMKCLMPTCPKFPVFCFYTHDIEDEIDMEDCSALADGDFFIYNLLLLWLLSPLTSTTIQILILFGFTINIQIGLILTNWIGYRWKNDSRCPEGEREWTKLDGTAVSRRSVAQVRVNSGDPGPCPKICLKEPGLNETSAGFQTDENRYYTLILAEKAEKR
ncbi:hypothetical protein I4U23_025417 [Adineta vaga]|nr:hypothetical protein I4U23_025417 [Adineta vaga]